MRLALLSAVLLFVAYCVAGCSYAGWTYTESNLTYGSE